MIDRLLAEPHRFEFFQAVRLLERWFAREEGADAKPDAASPRVVFRQSLSLAFPASEIAAFKVAWAESLPTGGDAAVLTPDVSVDATAAEPSQRGPATDSRAIRQIEITPAFMGFLGGGGTLPAFYTELIAQRELLHKDSSARALLDVFLHRAVVLFHHAWRKHRLAVQFEADRRRHALPTMLALAGVGSASLRDRLQPRRGGVADDTLAFFAATLQQRPKSPAMIRQIVGQYFDVAVVLEPFVGRWFTLPAADQTALGLHRSGLGGGAIVGERVWQRDLRVRLTLGPMPRERFDRFLPGGPAALALRELLTLLTGVSIEYEVRLALCAEDVRPACLAPQGAPLLGLDSFLVTAPSTVERSDPGYALHASR